MSKVAGGISPTSGPGFRFEYGISTATIRRECLIKKCREGERSHRRLHVPKWYILRLERGSSLGTLRPKYIF